MGIWLALQKLGSVIASAIQLGLNLSRDSKGKIGPNTYLVLVALQCLGLPLALLIAPPNKLIRQDGKKPILRSSSAPPKFKAEGKAFWRVMTTKRIALLMPVFMAVQWGQTYQGNFLAAYFTVRARALAALIIAIVGMIVNPLFGWFLDQRAWRRSRRAKISWAVVTVLYVAVFVWCLILQVEYANASTVPDLDYTSSGFGKGVAGYIVYR